MLSRVYLGGLNRQTSGVTQLRRPVIICLRPLVPQNADERSGRGAGLRQIDVSGSFIISKLPLPLKTQSGKCGSITPDTTEVKAAGSGRGTVWLPVQTKRQRRRRKDGVIGS